MFLGSGKTATTIYHHNSATGWQLEPDSGYPHHNIHIEGIFFAGYGSASTSDGGIRLTGTMDSTIRDCYIASYKGPQILIKGDGPAASGDAMYNTVENCSFAAVPSGEAAIELAC